MKNEVALLNFQCPGCGSLGSLREIVYGIPGPDFDFDKYIVGGCCVTVSDPEIGCKNCGWSGTARDMSSWVNY